MEDLELSFWPSKHYPGTYDGRANGGKPIIIDGQQVYANLYDNRHKIESGEWKPTSPHLKLRFKPVTAKKEPRAAYQEPDDIPF